MGNWMKRATLGLALATTGLALPGAATGKDKIVPVAQVEPGSATVDESKKKYCANVRTGSSRQSHRLCQTREKWLKKGIDPLAPSA